MHSKIIDAFVEVQVCLGVLDLAVREGVITEKKRKAKKYFPKGALFLIDEKMKEAYKVLESLVMEIDRERPSDAPVLPDDQPS